MIAITGHQRWWQVAYMSAVIILVLVPGVYGAAGLSLGVIACVRARAQALRTSAP